MDIEISKVFNSKSTKNDKENPSFLKKQTISESGLDLNYLETKIKEWIEKYSTPDTLRKKPNIINKFFRLNIFIDFCDM